MTAPNQNNRYQNADSSSIYNIKTNLNSFLSDFASLDFTNVVQNNLFNNIDGNGNLLHWNTYQVLSLTGKYNSTNKYIPITFAPSGSISQNISTNLKSNLSYSLILYGSSSVSGALKVSVSSLSNYQIYNLSVTTELNSASTMINSSVSGIVQKHIITFKTTATSAVSSDITVTIQNLTSNTVSGTFQNILVYDSLIELGSLPDSKELAIQTGIIPGALYINPIFDATGVAVSGVPLINTGYLKDIYTNRKYSFNALNNNFFLQELDYTTTQEPADPLGIKIQNDSGSATYYVRVVGGNLQLEEIQNISVVSPIIQDFENGCIYSMHVSGSTPTLYMRQDSFVPVDTVFSEVTSAGIPTGNKFIMIVNNGSLTIEQTDSSCLENPSTSATYKQMKDLSNGLCYKLSIVSGALNITQIVYNGYDKASYSVRDYDNNINYNLIIENGVISIVQAYSVSVDDIFAQGNINTAAISALSNKIDSDNALLSQSISALNNTFVIESNALSASITNLQSNISSVNSTLLLDNTNLSNAITTLNLNTNTLSASVSALTTDIYNIVSSFSTTALPNTIPLRDGYGKLLVSSGPSGGISFPNNAFGEPIDYATIQLLNPGGITGRSELTISVGSDPSSYSDADTINFKTTDSNNRGGVYVNGHSIYHNGNCVNSAYYGASGGPIPVGGYYTFPNGLILQWGKVYVSDIVSSTIISVTFPVSFPSAAVPSVFVSDECYTQFQLSTYAVQSITTSGFNIMATESISIVYPHTYHWYAIGTTDILYS